MALESQMPSFPQTSIYVRVGSGEVGLALESQMPSFPQTGIYVRVGSGEVGLALESHLATLNRPYTFACLAVANRRKQTEPS